MCNLMRGLSLCHAIHICNKSAFLGTVSSAKCTVKLLKLVEHRNQATRFIFSSRKQMSIYKYTADLCDGVAGFFIFTM